MAALHYGSPTLTSLTCNLILMKQRLLYTLLFVATIACATAQIPAGYYNSAAGKSGEELRTALYQIIKSHTAVSYNDLWNSYRATDVMPSGKVWDIYSDRPGETAAYYYEFGTDQCGSYTREGDCYNREHTVPQSWFGDATPMKTDLFHVYPTDGWVNNKRGNLQYGTVPSPTWTSTNGSKLGPCGFPGCSGTAFEPIDAYKGDLARSYFYMTVCYKDKNLGQTSESMFSGSQLLDWARQMMVEWHNADPVSEKEIDRNQVIYNQIQHNRNPFIDCPELVDYLFGSRVGEEWIPTCFEWNPDEVADYAATVPSCRIYPNPAIDVVMVESNLLEINKIEVFDITGRILQRYDEVGSSCFQIKLENLQAGYYLLKITTGKTVQVMTVVKQ